MQRCNVKSCKCGKTSDRNHHISVVRGRHYFLCDKCESELLDRLADPVMLRGMMKSYLTPAEWQKIINERHNAAVSQRLREKVDAMFATAGYPKHLALPEVTACPS